MIKSQTFFRVLLLCSVLLTLSGCAQRPTPDQAAQAMAEVVLPAGWKGAFDSMAAIPTDDFAKIISEWAPALEKNGAGAHAQLVQSMFFYVPQVRGLFQNGVFMPERGAEFGKRLQTLTSDTVAPWQDAMQEASGVKPDVSNSLLEMMQVSRLFENGDFRQDRFNVTLAQLRSIPAEALDGWARVSSDRDMVALSLLETEAVFDEDRFDIELFRQALPQALVLYEARSAELKK